MNASTVSQVHGEPDLMMSDNWPYMRTASSGFAVAVASPNPEPQEVSTSHFRSPRWPPSRQTGSCSPPPANNFPSQGNYVGSAQEERWLAQQQEAQTEDGAYAKLVKSTMLPFSTLGVPKHVFKVRETTKLLLFLGVAAGGILLLDLSARLLISIAHNKCANK